MKSPEKPKSGEPRKPYKTPVVRSYGSVQAITRNSGTMSATMDGANSKAKTS